MLFGLHGVPAMSQRMTDRLHRDVTSYAVAYLDDVVIHSSWDDHLCEVWIILQKPRDSDAGLTIKPYECQFAMECCSYHWHIVGNGEVHPEEAKLVAASSFPISTTKKQVWAFLGLIEYRNYRKFITDYANIASPLTDLECTQCSGLD